ncbi:MAG: adenosylmethionine decarboxylase [Deltaproteobacteria bacterium]|jgi:S-adenosylmethionine decarboxylase
MMLASVAAQREAPCASFDTYPSNPSPPEHIPIESVPKAKDHFVRRDGLEFAGEHLLVDLWGAQRLDDIDLMGRALRAAVKAAGATLLHIHLHHFTIQGGISGVAILAESHISVHTWPERHFAAFDIFMCGDSRPDKAVEIIKNNFAPARMTIGRNLRGMVQHD